MARWWKDSGVVDQDEFVEIELVGESFPFGLVQDSFVVVVSGITKFSVTVRLDLIFVLPPVGHFKGVAVKGEGV